MKHTIPITLALVLMFLLTQLVGLVITSQYITTTVTEAGVEVIQWKQLPFDVQRPEVNESQSYIFIILAILIGTGIAILIMKYKKRMIWKGWFFVSVLICLTFAFGAFLPELIAFVLALVLSIFKVFRSNIYVHNFTEIFLYAGIAAIFVPIMNLFAAVMLLILISAYDMYAVWHSKHMVALAKFQTGQKLFAGLFIPYDRKAAPEIKEAVPEKANTSAPKAPRTAILGGGDVAFPLIFSAVVMKSMGIINAITISIVVTISLFLLFYFAKKDKFYPAMPFLTLGCFVGYGIVLAVSLVP